MDKYINSLIDDLDEFLKCSSVDFENEVREYNTNSENHAYFASERMLSNLSNHYLSSLLMEKHNFNIKLALSEFPINILNSSSKLNVVSSETAEVDLKNIKWNRCYVDGYFKIETDEENYHIFLEYKMQNIFDYIDLAKDYLKYKLYTYNCNLNTIFGYVIFKKEDNYPSIIENTNKKFCYLKKNISPQDIYDTRIQNINRKLT